MIDEVGLGKLLQSARKKAGLTQQELCQKAELSYSTLAKIERGAIKSPSIFTVQSIAHALGTSINELMGDEGPQAENNAKMPKKRSKSGIRFVYFDINGCLVRFFHRAFTRISSETGARADVVETTFWHYNDVACRGEMTVEEFNKAFAEKLGVKSIDWKKYYMEEVDPIEEMHELVKWASENYYVGLLSNIMSGFVDSMLKNGLLPDIQYSAIVDSSEVNTIKPEPKIYEIAQGLTGCEPNEVLLVDDSRTNLVAAEKMGWHVLWFDDYRPSESAIKVKATLEPAD